MARFTRTTQRALVAASAMTVAALALAGCSGSGSSDAESGDTLVLWHYEGEDSAMGKAWDAAIETFKEENPDVTVEFEAKGFEQIRSTASQVLNSDEAPDVMEYNKGNATAGLLASQGLLTDLNDAVAEYGWGDLLAPAALPVPGRAGCRIHGHARHAADGPGLPGRPRGRVP